MTDEKIMDELKPCPFCGGGSTMFLLGKTVTVECNVCGAVIGGFDGDNDAIESWNTRAAERLSKIEVLEKLIDQVGFDIGGLAYNYIRTQIKDLKEGQ